MNHLHRRFLRSLLCETAKCDRHWVVRGARTKLPKYQASTADKFVEVDLARPRILG
jgi:hypothetical protein